MATKDHTLDQRIVDAARAEFMEHGFQKASLHKIADRAGITTGALYTRYRSKDALFCSLIQGVTDEIASHAGPMEQMYLKARQQRSPELLLSAIQAEEQIYLELLFDQYEACVLLFCKSAGSSIEQQMNQMMEHKARQTVSFFQSMFSKDLDCDGIELLISVQFSHYRQMLLRGYSKEKAISCMKTVDLFLEAGWKAIFSKII